MHDKIMIVDDEKIIRQILSQKLEFFGYCCDTASDGLEAYERIKNDTYALVLLDIRLPRRDGLQLLEDIQKLDKHTQVIMMTSLMELDIAIKALQLGASDYITKPFNTQHLMISVKRALEKRRLILDNLDYRKNLEKKVNEQTQTLRTAYQRIKQDSEMILHILVAMLDAYEHETRNHSRRVMDYAALIACKLDLTEEAVQDIARGALLHDIGKIGTPQHILLKKGPLTTEEWRIMRMHPQTGHDIIKDIDFLKVAAEIVLSHQEYFDGSGYPRELKEQEIPLGARIFAIVDSFDAMTSDRSYRPACSYEAARREIARYANTQFDPELVKTFMWIRKQEWEEIKIRHDGHGFKEDYTEEYAQNYMEGGAGFSAP